MKHRPRDWMTLVQLGNRQFREAYTISGSTVELTGLEEAAVCTGKSCGKSSLKGGSSSGVRLIVCQKNNEPNVDITVLVPDILRLRMSV